MEDTLEKFTERKVGWRCDVEVIPKTSSNILATYKVGIYVNGSEKSLAGRNWLHLTFEMARGNSSTLAPHVFPNSTKFDSARLCPCLHLIQSTKAQMRRLHVKL